MGQISAEEGAVKRVIRVPSDLSYVRKVWRVFRVFAMALSLIKTENSWRGRKEIEMAVCLNAREPWVASFRSDHALGDGCLSLKVGDGRYRTFSQGDRCKAIWMGDVRHDCISAFCCQGMWCVPCNLPILDLPFILVLFLSIPSL